MRVALSLSAALGVPGLARFELRVRWWPAIPNWRQAVAGPLGRRDCFDMDPSSAHSGRRKIRGGGLGALACEFVEAQSTVGVNGVLS